MSIISAASRLRLASARRRIASFIEQIDLLAESSFPHDDGKQVLEKIKMQFEDLRKLLELPPTADDDYADQVCTDVAWKISDYTDILGLVLRSTNVRNAFELHHVLKGLVERILGQPTDLLISSEWAFVPFTYPVGIDLLPSVVLIGSPAPESENALIVPLAGHEIGHSAWRVADVAQAMTADLYTAVDAAIAANSAIAPGDDDLFVHSSANVYRDRCAEYAMRQLEEIYCDLIGLYMFGPAYLYAFDYLLGPGGFDRSLDYPSDAQRMAILADMADQLSIHVDPALRHQWSKPTIDFEYKRLIAIVDKAVMDMVEPLKRVVSDFVASSGLSPPAAAEIDSIFVSYERGQPYAGSASLGAIISAGWKLLREKEDLCTEAQRDEFKVLCDLIWKTIEVTEYLEKGSLPDA